MHRTWAFRKFTKISPNHVMPDAQLYETFRLAPTETFRGDTPIQSCLYDCLWTSHLSHTRLFIGILSFTDTKVITRAFPSAGIKAHPWELQRGHRALSVLNVQDLDHEGRICDCRQQKRASIFAGGEGRSRRLRCIDEIARSQCSVSRMFRLNPCISISREPYPEDQLRQPSCDIIVCLKMRPWKLVVSAAKVLHWRGEFIGLAGPSSLAFFFAKWATFEPTKTMIRNPWN